MSPDPLESSQTAPSSPRQVQTTDVSDGGKTTSATAAVDIAAQSAPEEFGGAGAEPAIRAWARENHIVADAVDRIDAKRMAYLTALLTEIGLTNSDLSRIIYGALLGMQDLSTRDGADNSQALGTLVDLIIALYEEE